ncbi:MAG: LPS export ABC transporter periplasmic protein LptC [Chitinophagaceae bacterium]
MAVGIGCLFMLVFSLPSCKKKPVAIKKLAGKELNVDVANTVDAYMSNGGKMKARLRAPQMLSFSDSTFRIEFPNTMHVDFFNDSSVIESQLDSRTGMYYESQAKVFLKDSVRVFNITGDTLYANELWWDQRSQEFYTDKPVRIHRPTMIMIGVGLKAPQDFKMFEVYKITNSILRVKDLGEMSSPTDSVAQKNLKPE